MDISKILQKAKLPSVFIRENKECFYDPYRKRLIEIIPEEIVRQKIAYYYDYYLGVPRELLWLEVPMSYYTTGCPGRADIIIHERLEDNLLYPVAVIECKNSETPLTDRVVDQVVNYCNSIGANYAIVTNGKELEIAKYNEETNFYEWLDNLLTYSEMKESKCGTIIENRVYIRLSIQELRNNDIIKKFNEGNIHWVYGLDTPKELKGFIVNLYECLRDTSHKLPLVQRKNFEVIEDLGIRYMDYSNAAGGHYNGYFRSFLVKDFNADTQIVSLSIFGTASNFDNQKRKSYTSLVVSIDKYKISHNILQYNIDRYTIFNDDKIEFFHNGQISSLPYKPLMEYVSATSENIQYNLGKLYLGELYNTEILFLDDTKVSNLIYNFIEYGLLREEYRKRTK